MVILLLYRILQPGCWNMVITIVVKSSIFIVVESFRIILVNSIV
jgi:hypothetical protein